MKLIPTIISTVLISTITYGQNEPSKKMPPISMFKGKPGEKKIIFELPHMTDYKIYSAKGKLISSAHAEFIDMTKLKSGTYFITYDDEKIEFVK